MAGVKSEARHSAIIPILNRECSIPTSLPIAISSQISFQKIRGDDLAIITEEDDDASSFIKGGTYTLTVEPFSPDDGIEALNGHIAAAIFSINILGNGLPISVDKAYVIRTLRKTTLKSTHQVNGHRHPNVGKFEISKGVDLSDASTVFSAVCVALEKHAPLRITLSRFNSAMGKVALDDRVIDLCISLESIFEAKTEISFQFALYNSLLSEDDSSRRAAIFKTLKKLYNERSNIVHGSKEVDEQWAKEKWDDIVRIAKAAILKKVDFLARSDHKNWKQELENLALGVKSDGAKGE